MVFRFLSIKRERERGGAEGGGGEGVGTDVTSAAGAVAGRSHQDSASLPPVASLLSGQTKLRDLATAA